MDKLFSFIAIVSVVVLCILACLTDKHTRQEVNIIHSDTVRISDTIVLYDTIRIKEPAPYRVEVVKTDTIRLNDTLFVPVPIERKTYQNEYYRAIVEGYKPNLVSLDLFRKDVTINDREIITNTNTITRTKRPLWVVSVGPGIGYNPRGVDFYVGVNAGIAIYSR